jgi:hypothetical protein
MAKVKLHSFLFSLAEKAGIDPKDAGLTEILSNQAWIILNYLRTWKVQ